MAVAPQQGYVRMDMKADMRFCDMDTWVPAHAFNKLLDEVAGCQVQYQAGRNDALAKLAAFTGEAPFRVGDGDEGARFPAGKVFVHLDGGNTRAQIAKVSAGLAAMKFNQAERHGAGGGSALFNSTRANATQGTAGAFDTPSAFPALAEASSRGQQHNDSILAVATGLANIRKEANANRYARETFEGTVVEWRD